MKPFRTPDSPWSIIQVSRFPREILYMIGLFSSFETLASLVQCDRWLHSTCSTLLFREVHIWSPPQIVKIRDNETAMRSLSRTKCLVLGDNIFLSSSWKCIPNVSGSEMLGYIICILHATPALVQLQISGHYTGADYFKAGIMDISRTSCYRQFNQMIAKHMLDPTFLPNLAILNRFHTDVPLHSLYHGRAVAYCCHIDQYGLYLDVCPGMSRSTTNGTKTSSLEAMASFSAKDVGEIVRKTKSTNPLSLPAYTLDITMRFPDEIRRHKPCPITDPLPWVRTMLAAADFSTGKLESLEIRFNPSPPRQPLAVQCAAIEELHKSFPSFHSASISSPHIVWHPSSPRGDLPAWMVYPRIDIPETIEWWCDVLKLGNPHAQTGTELEETAKRLNKEMHLRWNVCGVPSVEELINYLRHK